MFRQVVVLVVDGCGVGTLPDAQEYRHRGANTLANVSTYTGGFDLPLLQWMGLGNVTQVRGCAPAEPPASSFGRMARHSPGTDAEAGFGELFSGTLESLVAGGYDVLAIGGAAALLGEEQATVHHPSVAVEDVLDRIVEALTIPVTGVVVAMVAPPTPDDPEAGRSPVEVARLLKRVDAGLGAVLDVMTTESLFVMTSLRGLDMTLPVVDGPTREFGPLLAYAPAVPSGVELGTRASLADVAATIAENFGIPEFQAGTSFYGPLLS